MKRVWLVLALLSACSRLEPEPVSTSVLVPSAMQVCPDGTAAPDPPPAPRSLKQLVDYTLHLYAALMKTEHARQECASRLTELNLWISLMRVNARD